MTRFSTLLRYGAIVSVLGVVTGLAVVGCQRTSTGPSPSGGNSLQGGWKVLSVTQEGKQLAPEANARTFSFQRIYFAQDRAYFWFPEEPFNEVPLVMNYSTDLTKQPATLDLTLRTPGDRTKNGMLGLFELNGDELTMCLDF